MLTFMIFVGKYLNVVFWIKFRGNDYETKHRPLVYHWSLDLLYVRYHYKQLLIKRLLWVMLFFSLRFYFIEEYWPIITVYFHSDTVYIWRYAIRMFIRITQVE